MTTHNAPKPRGRPSLAGGRAATVQTSLSPAQAAWVRSRPEGASAYLRGLVAEDMLIQETPEDMADAFHRFLVKIGGDV